ncbi:MAG: hypothetical protein COB98_06355 [Flavobacteriaceae bacterium]|nr:MAG: hypothetical protein COB98_06355 [Flavobacteriaceae bacterium]
MVITVGISLYGTRLVLLALGAGDFGVFNVVGGAIAMLTFLNAAMASATQRFMSYAQGEGNDKKQKNIFNVSVLLHFFIAIAVVLLLEVAGYVLFNGVLKIAPDRMEAAQLIYQFLIVSAFFTIISVPYDAVINAHENMLFVAVLGILESILKLAIAFFITYTAFDKLASYGFLMASLAVLLLVIRRIYCHRKYEEVEVNIRKHFDKPLFKEMTSFAGWSLLGSAASIVTMQGTTIILNSFFGVLVNAAQGVSNQISGQLMAFSNTMLKALNPVIVKSEGSNNRKQMLTASMFGNKLSYLLLAFFAIPVIIEMPYILGVWLKNVPEYAVVFCRLSLIRLSLTQLTVTFSTAIGATGDIKEYTIYRAIIFMFLLPCCYFIFTTGAPPAAIYVSLIMMVLVLLVVDVYYGHKRCGLSVEIFIKDVIIRCLNSTILISSIVSIPLFFMDACFFRLFMVLCLNLIAFLTVTFTIGLSKTEKLIVYPVIKSGVNRLKKNKLWG